MKLVPQSLAALILLAFVPSPLRAEGSKKFNGAFGVNRVVRTKSTGFVEVAGSFYVNASLPNPQINPAAKDHANRPNPYLEGNVGGVEYDGGLIWEPERTQRNGVVYNPGWAAFIYGNKVATSPQILVSNRSIPWRYSNGQTPTSVSMGSQLRMTFRDDGKVSLFVGAMPFGGTFFHAGKLVRARPATPATSTHPARPAIPITPIQSDGLVLFRRNRLRTADVKRVSALTRAGDPRLPVIFQLLLGSKAFHDELDGSVVTISWSDGQVRKRGGHLRPWVKGDVNQGATGYDGAPDGASAFKDYDMVAQNFNGKLVLSRDVSGHVVSRKTVEFPFLVQGSAVGRKSSDASQGATESPALSRYTQETVQINLRSSSAPWGITLGVGGGN